MVPGALADQPHPLQIGLQDAATPVMERLNSFHNLLLVVITLITIFVLGLLVYVMWRFNAKRNPTPSRTSHNTLIEVVWTVVPVIILLFIAVPSFSLLYYMNRSEDPEMTLIVHGYQWYWGYEFPDQQIPEFESRMVPDAELQEGDLRLLSVTEPLVLPVDTDIQILIRAEDVLHSWAVPSFGIKTDAVPMRMNETWARIEQEGVYYGMCSELCGEGHGFMPIEIHAVSREAFDDWVMEQVAGLDLEEPPHLLTRSYEDAVNQNQVAEAE
ncbi:MAG: cytochrome c oxidase subunit II [Rhodospirillaceae bacterium]|nr:cytochrome c oxidase subunit II [Rhodospirillaceae bacterium]